MVGIRPDIFVILAHDRHNAEISSPRVVRIGHVEISRFAIRAVAPGDSVRAVRADELRPHVTLRVITVFGYIVAIHADIA